MLCEPRGSQDEGTKTLPLVPLEQLDLAVSDFCHICSFCGYIGCVEIHQCMIYMLQCVPQIELHFVSLKVVLFSSVQMVMCQCTQMSVCYMYIHTCICVSAHAQVHTYTASKCALLLIQGLQCIQCTIYCVSLCHFTAVWVTNNKNNTSH